MRAGEVVAGRFGVLARAGAGGMGVVYRAQDRATGAVVALKILTGHGADATERFAREALVLSELRHPGVVRYVAHGTTSDGEGFLAMEWLDGESLADRLARGPFSIPEALVLAHRVAEALALAHARGIVHRDLKPGNLVLRQGRVEHAVVLDFGIARLLAPGQTLTLTGAMLGTPGYMAPEQARAGVIDPRTDVYALGCVLYRALAGRTPHEAESPMAVLLKAVNEDPVPLDRVRSDVPPPLAALVARMLARDPSARPRDAAEVAAGVAWIAQHLGIAIPAREALPEPVLPPTWGMTSFAPAPTMTGSTTAAVAATAQTTPAAPARRSATPIVVGGVLSVLGVAAAVAAVMLTSGSRAHTQCLADGCAELDVDDASHVEPIAILPQATDLARSIDRAAKLIRIDADLTGGAVDLSRDHAMFQFGGDPSGGAFKTSIVVLVSNGHMSAMRSAQAVPFGAIPEPRCSARAAWKAATTAGLPSGVPAHVSYYVDPASSQPVAMVTGKGGAMVFRASDCKRVM